MMPRSTDIPVNATDGDAAVGLYRKYNVNRTDGSTEPGRKHGDCEYFVIDLKHDKYAEAALRAYAFACEAEFPMLAQDLFRKIAHE